MQRGNKRAPGLQRFYPLKMDLGDHQGPWLHALWQVMQHGPSNANTALPPVLWPACAGPTASVVLRSTRGTGH